jgi:uridine kinase
MKGDSIIVEPHHVKAARGIIALIEPRISPSSARLTVTIAGQSGSGKSETATALARALEERGTTSAILQQDDYFVYPPKTNDSTRRRDIDWVGPREVRLDLLDSHLATFLEGAEEIRKPLVIYEEDRISEEVLPVKGVQVLIAEGTYTTLLENAGSRVFIDRDYRQTRGHREKRSRNAAELDEFIERVLAIEHEIISGHKARADIIVTSDYQAQANA